MKWAMICCFVAVVCAVFWQWQLSNNMDNVAYARAKNALDRATHDASLQVDPVQLGKGQIVYDTSRALQAFTKTLRENMMLDGSLQALPKTFFNGQVAIVGMDVVDDANVQARYNRKFDGTGLLYKYQGYGKSFQKMIYGPAIIFGIQIRKPLDTGTTPETYYFVSIYEYPENK
jgi:hypothetical protein